jgi:light-regulated signal transduction histidine kinase (bacteriophytochrome)
VLHELPVANADPNLVPVLLLNVLSNAMKYTRSKPVRKIEVGAQLIDGSMTYFIADNGIGFSSDSAQRLFRAFERETEDNASDGLGLGLDIVSRIIERHDGRIWADGDRGRGATFYFTLGPAGSPS